MDIFLNRKQYEAVILNEQLTKTTEVHPVAVTPWGWLHYCVCIEINIAWSGWHHLAGLLSDMTPQHHGNMYADGYWIQIRARPDIQQPLLQLSERESGWATHKHTHMYLSQQFLGSFPVCYILSRKTTKLFLKPRIHDNMVGTVQ